MDILEKTVCSRIQDVVEKLQKMECTLLGNGEDTWIMELLFKPGFHRYDLIDWILSKFEYNVRKITGLQNSAEERLNKLLTTISDLGICVENSHEVIKGTAPLNDQLEFWCMLVELLWLKYEITGSLSLTEDELVEFSPEKSGRKAIYEEYREATACVSNICTSINLNHLFCHDIQLLAPDVQSETEQISVSELKKRIDVCSLEDLKHLAKQKNPSSNPKELFKALLSEDDTDITEHDEDLVYEEELNQLEDCMLKISQQIQDCTKGAFNDVYTELKPLIIRTSPEEFVDVGPTFQKVERNLEVILELKESLSKLASADSKLQKTNCELDAFTIHQKTADSEVLHDIERLLSEEIY